MKSTKIEVHMKDIGDESFKYDSGAAECMIYWVTMLVQEFEHW